MKVKSKSLSRFVIHATPLHGGSGDNEANEKEDVKLEMKTFGKNKYKGSTMYTTFYMYRYSANDSLYHIQR